MADQTPQNFASHTKLVPPFHFFVVPILMFNLLWRGYRLYFHFFVEGHGRGDATFDFLLALAFIGTALAARIFALQAQDRVIRLEEHLRWKGLLTPEQYNRRGELQRGQIIALRFAPDDEVAGLYARILTGDLKQPKAVKQAIKTWRPDYFRL
jgi:hypothetical protein